MYVVVAAFFSALPAFFFAWVALRQRGQDSYEDRLERDNFDLKEANAELRRRLEEVQEENLRLMRKLLANGGSHE